VDQGLLEIQVHQVSLVFLEEREPQGLLVIRVLQAILDQMVQPVKQDQMDRLVVLVQMDQMVNPACLVRVVHQGPQEFQVQ